jgi:hypothetical protein
VTPSQPRPPDGPPHPPGTPQPPGPRPILHPHDRKFKSPARAPPDTGRAGPGHPRARKTGPCTPLHNSETNGLPGAGGWLRSVSNVPDQPLPKSRRGWSGTTTTLHHPPKSQSQDQDQDQKRRGNPETPPASAHQAPRFPGSPRTPLLPSPEGQDQVQSQDQSWLLDVAATVKAQQPCQDAYGLHQRAGTETGTVRTRPCPLVLRFG